MLVLEDTHICLNSEDIETARSLGIRIGPLLRDFFHTYVSAPTTEAVQLEALKKQEEEISKQMSELANKRHSIVATISKLNKELDKASKEAEDAKRKRAELLSHCVLCKQELSPRDLQFLKFGPHKMLKVCGTTSRGCCRRVLDSPDKRWWIMGPEKEEIENAGETRESRTTPDAADQVH